MLVYVASPYSNVADKDKLMSAIAKMSGQYMLDNPGEYTVTGLVHHYACAHHPDLGTDYKYWKHFCEEFLPRFDKLLVLKFPGWDVSTGVKSEMDLATTLDIPVVLMDVPANILD